MTPVTSARPPIPRAALLAASCGALAACNTTPTIVVGELREVIALPALPSRDLDLLFVIDNSPSMIEKQDALIETFPRMIDALVRLDGGLPDLHIGVVSTDLGTQGSAVAAPGPDVGVPGLGGCSGLGDDGVLLHAALPELPGGYLADVADPAAPDGRARNYSGELRDVFAQLARLGDGGCGFEQPLAAMRRALSHPANQGFLRPEANLAVVIIADEDDCSLRDPALLGDDPALGPLGSFRCFEHGVVCRPDAPRTVGDKAQCQPREDSALVEPVAPFVDALLATKPDPRKVMVAGIVGRDGPVRIEPRGPRGTEVGLAAACAFAGPSGAQPVEPAVRLTAFLDAFPGRSQRASLCEGSLVPPLALISDSVRRLVGDPCLDTSVLADASDEPGVQPACEVTDVRDAAPDQPTVLPRCGDGAGDCYTFVADPHACPARADHLRISLSRATSAAAGTWTHVRCLRAR